MLFLVRDQAFPEVDCPKAKGLANVDPANFGPMVRESWQTSRPDVGVGAILLTKD